MFGGEQMEHEAQLVVVERLPFLRNFDRKNLLHTKSRLLTIAVANVEERLRMWKDTN